MDRILLPITAEEKRAFRERCAARGMTMAGRIRMMIIQDKWDYEGSYSGGIWPIAGLDQREKSERWKEITQNNKRGNSDAGRS